MIRNLDPESKKLVHCELQPFRNAGDSPECWYSDFKESAGNEIMNTELSAGIVFEQHSLGIVLSYCLLIIVTLPWPVPKWTIKASLN